MSMFDEATGADPGPAGGIILYLLAGLQRPPMSYGGGQKEGGLGYPCLGCRFHGRTSEKQQKMCRWIDGLPWRCTFILSLHEGIITWRRPQGLAISDKIQDRLLNENHTTNCG